MEAAAVETAAVKTQATTAVPAKSATWSQLALSCALLAAAVALPAVIGAWIANGELSQPALLQALVGGGICWVAASLALVTAFIANRQQWPVQGVLIGMMFRMGLPLAALIVLPKLGGVLAGATAAILGAYLVALLVETLLSLRMIPPNGRLTRTAT